MLRIQTHLVALVAILVFVQLQIDLRHGFSDDTDHQVLTEQEGAGFSDRASRPGGTARKKNKNLGERPNMSDVATLLKRIDDEGIRNVDFCFTDPRGKWHHLTYHVSAVDAELFADGVMFDGSSIAGWKDISESDMLLNPRPDTAAMDPFSELPTLMLVCDASFATTMTRASSAIKLSI